MPKGTYWVMVPSRRITACAETRSVAVSRKEGCASGDKSPAKRWSIQGPPNSPAGRLMPCTTMRSGATPFGRASKFGERTWRTRARRPVAGSICSDSVMQVLREAGVKDGQQPRDENTIERSRAADGGDGGTERLDRAQVEKVRADERPEAAADVGEGRRPAARQRDGDDGG